MPVVALEKRAAVNSVRWRFQVEIHGVNGRTFPQPITEVVEEDRPPSEALAELLILKVAACKAREGKLPVGLCDIEMVSGHCHQL